MSSIDERIVQMRFENSQFEKGIEQTNSSLTKLKSSLKFDKAQGSLQYLADQAKNFHFGDMIKAIDDVSSKFTFLSGVGVVALGNLASAAIATGTQLIDSLTIQPVMDGLREYETNINSIQTILANTSSKGTTLDQVNAALQDLNNYSDKTIYNFSEMARNIGTFTAAGIDLDKATLAIKGIANLAAVSGSNATQASTAMYQLSQALASGTVKLQDWNSVVNAGMGGAVFQDALKQTARNHGIAVDKIIKKEGSFRQSLQTGWLSSQILTETLSKFTGDLTDEQLKSMGYTEKQIVEIQKMAKMASDAATKVKTFSQLTSTLQEAVGSGWAQTWQILIGDFEEARTMYTNVSNVITDMITASANARNNMLKDWKTLGGRTTLIDTVSSAFRTLMDIFKVVSKAFEDIFPPTTGKQLYDLTVAIKTFVEGLKMSSEGLDNLKRTFRGVFAVFGIAWELIKAIGTALFNLFGFMGQGSGNILKFTGNFGDLIYNFYQALKAGNVLSKFFSGIANIIKIPVAIIKSLIAVVASLFNYFMSLGGAGSTLGSQLEKRFKPLGDLGDTLTKIWSGVYKAFEAVTKFMEPAIKVMGDAFTKFGERFTSVFTNANYDSMLSTINTTFLGGLVLLFKKFFSKGINLQVFGGLDKITGSIKSVFGSLESYLKSMQQNVKSKIIMNIAIAIALLTASVIALTMVDQAKMTSALAAMLGIIVEMMLAMKLIGGITGGAGFKSIFATSLALIFLATAIGILAGAVALLSKFSWEDLAKGLGAVGVLLAMIVGVVNTLGKKPKGMLLASVGMIAIAASVKILASAVGDLAKMSWEQLQKGMIALGVVLAQIVIFNRLISASKGAVANALGLVLVAASVKIFASAVQDFGKIPMEKMVQGLQGMAAALVIIAVAMRLMPKDMLITSIGLVATAVALNIMAKALTTMGGMSMDQIGKGLGVMAASLGILAASLMIMSGSLAGSFALLVAATALTLLTVPLLIFGKMKWDTIVKGLTVLAASLAIIGIAGFLLIGALPGLLGLGAATLMIGVGTLAAGAGILAMAVALGILIGIASGGTAVIVAIVASLINLIPLFIIKIGEGLIGLLNVIAASGDAIMKAIEVILLALINALAAVVPPLIELIFNILNQLLVKLVEFTPKLVEAGMNIIISFLDGIAKKLPDVIAKAADIIVAIIKGIGDNAGRIIDEGVKTVVKFVDGVAEGVKNNTQKFVDAGSKLFRAIADGIATAIKQGGKDIHYAGEVIGQALLDGAKAALGINSPSKEFYKLGEFASQGITGGLNDTAKYAGQAAANVGNVAISSLSKSLAGVSDLAISNLDMSPTIKPVVDLTDVQKSAKAMDGLFTPTTLQVGSAYANATSIAADQQAAIDAQQVIDNTQTTGDTIISFTQNNNSPKALTPTEIYRQTKNQISAAKGNLAVI